MRFHCVSSMRHCLSLRRCSAPLRLRATNRSLRRPRCTAHRPQPTISLIDTHNRTDTHKRTCARKTACRAVMLGVSVLSSRAGDGRAGRSGGGRPRHAPVDPAGDPAVRRVKEPRSPMRAGGSCPTHRRSRVFSGRRRSSRSRSSDQLCGKRRPASIVLPGRRLVGKAGRGRVGVRCRRHRRRRWGGLLGGRLGVAGGRTWT